MNNLELKCAFQPIRGSEAAKPGINTLVSLSYLIITAQHVLIKFSVPSSFWELPVPTYANGMLRGGIIIKKRENFGLFSK